MDGAKDSVKRGKLQVESREVAARPPAAPVRDPAVLEAILGSSLDPLITADAHGRILLVSDSVERLFGWKPAELIGRNVSVLAPEPHRSRHDTYLAAHRRTGRSTIIGRTNEWEAVRKDGSRVSVAVSVSRARPAGASADVFTAIFRESPGARRADQEATANERRFHAIFDQAFQSLGLLEPDGTLLETNQSTLDATGIKREEVVGKKFWEATWWSHSPEASERVREAIATAAGGKFVRFEISVRGRGQELIDIDFSIKPVRDDDGRVVLLIPEGRDITQLKRAQRTETSMLRALAQVGESAAVLAHEIKNPITAVNVALRAVADQLGEDQSAVLEDLVGRMQRLEQQIRGTLNFAKPIELKRVPLSARRFLTDVIARQRLAILRCGAEVSAEAAAGLHLRVDPQYLEEVLANLIQNALEVPGKGRKVVLSAVPDGDRGVLIAVDDDGPGVPVNMRLEVFRPFITSKRSGTGLGLPICRKIVEEHGGTIAIETSDLGGARFEMRFPESRERKQ